MPTKKIVKQAQRITPIPGRFTDVILFGPVGSGKDATSHQLEVLGLTHLSTSNVFRFFRGNELERHLLGNEAEKLDRGELLSDHVTMACYARYAELHGVWGDVIVHNGICRTKPQAESFPHLIQTHRRHRQIFVFDLTEVTLDIALERTAKRTTDAVGLGGEGRQDDDPDTVKRRHKEFVKTRPVILTTFKKYATVFPIDSSRTLQDKLRDIVAVLGLTEQAQELGML